MLHDCLATSSVNVRVGCFFLTKRSISAFSHSFHQSHLKPLRRDVRCQHWYRELTSICVQLGQGLENGTYCFSKTAVGSHSWKEQYTMYYNPSFNITHKHVNLNTVKTTTKKIAAQSACIHFSLNYIQQTLKKNYYKC